MSKKLKPADKARAILLENNRLRVDMMVSLLCTQAEMSAACGFCGWSVDFHLYVDVLTEIIDKLEEAGFKVDTTGNYRYSITFHESV